VKSAWYIEPYYIEWYNKEEVGNMKCAIKAFETKGEIQEQKHLILEDPLPVTCSGQVRIIILLPEETEINEKDWLKTASKNHSFHFLNDPEEDIYTLSDGRPFYDKK